MSCEENVSDGRELPLSARNALVHLLLRDLEAVSSDDAVACAIHLLDTRGSSAPAEVIDEARRALRASGMPTTGAGDDCRAGSPAPPWAATARLRLDAYARVLAVVPRGTALDVRLAQSRRMLAHRLFFEVHEVLEPAWREASGAERTILQGVIQAAVSWHHASRRNHGAALRMAGAAHAKLVAAPATWHGFPLAALRESLQTFLAAAADGAANEPPALPWAARDGGA